MTYTNNLRPIVIVVSGRSGSGKTTLATALAAHLALPLLTKDTVKEALFDTLGWSDRAWSRRLGPAAVAVLFGQLDALLAARQSCVVESTFRADEDGPRLRALCDRYEVLPVEIVCIAPGPLLVKRVRARLAAGARHPGHGDGLDPAELDALREAGPLAPLGLGGPSRTLDTSAPDGLDVPALAAWVEAQRAPGEVAYLAGLPRKRMAAALLFRNHAGAVLLVEPTYRTDWLLPGGVVEADESPRTAAAREACEELGLVLVPGLILCVEYRSASPDRDEALHCVFDGGLLDPVACAQIKLPPGELRGWGWFTPEEATKRLDRWAARRLGLALRALAAGRTLYAEDGVALPDTRG